MDQINSTTSTNTANTGTPACETCVGGIEATNNPSFADHLERAKNDNVNSSEQQEQLAASVLALQANRPEEQAALVEPVTNGKTAIDEDIKSANPTPSPIENESFDSVLQLLSELNENQVSPTGHSEPPQSTSGNISEITQKVPGAIPVDLQFSQTPPVSNTQPSPLSPGNQQSIAQTDQERDSSISGELNNRSAPLTAPTKSTGTISEPNPSLRIDGPTQETASQSQLTGTVKTTIASDNSTLINQQKTAPVHPNEIDTNNIAQNPETLKSSLASKLAAIQHATPSTALNGGQPTVDRVRELGMAEAGNATSTRTIESGTSPQAEHSQSTTSLMQRLQPLAQAIPPSQTLAIKLQNSPVTPDIILPALNITPTTESAQPMALTAAGNSSAVPQVPLNNLAVHIAAQVRAGNQRFEIRLDPPELGRIDIRLEIGRDGQTLAHLSVEKPETLELLRQDARQLERALASAGLDARNGALSFSLREDGQNKHQANEADQQKQQPANDPTPEENEETSTVIKQTINVSSGLDISI